MTSLLREIVLRKLFTCYLLICKADLLIRLPHVINRTLRSYPSIEDKSSRCTGGDLHARNSLSRGRAAAAARSDAAGKMTRSMAVRKWARKRRRRPFGRLHQRHENQIVTLSPISHCIYDFSQALSL